MARLAQWSDIKPPTFDCKIKPEDNYKDVVDPDQTKRFNDMEVRIKQLQTIADAYEAGNIELSNKLLKELEGVNNEQ